MFVSLSVCVGRAFDGVLARRPLHRLTQIEGLMSQAPRKGPPHMFQRCEIPAQYNPQSGLFGKKRSSLA